MTYYNENDPKAAAWLRELIRAGLIPAGDIDERSICDVSPHDLRGYIQQHFFAGIGGWAFALRLAGWPDTRPVRTGSCPCQPFSAAGKGLGDKDARHLWPVFRDLITFGEATVTFGEQVASAAGRVWLAGIRADLEGLGYGVGGADLCSAGVGSPNIRQRLYWMAHATGPRRYGREESGTIGITSRAGYSENREISGRIESSRNGSTCRLADTPSASGAQQQREPRGDLRRPAATPYTPERSGPDSARWLGNTGCRGDESVGQRGDASCEASKAQGQERQQWCGDAARDADPGSVRLEHTESDGRQQRRTEPGERSVVGGCGVERLGDTNDPRSQGRNEREHRPDQWTPWSSSVALPCTDGKARRIEPGSFPLAHGIPGRVGLLRGYGNAINPWLAAEFILACEEAINLA